jgi:hypothetical protein
MRRTTAWGCAFASALYFTAATTIPISRAHASPPSAPPPSSSGDAIFLKGGAVVRGTIIDILPGDHARILLASGEVELVSWATIERIERAPIGASPSPTPSPVAPAPSTSLPSRAGPSLDPAVPPGANRVPAVTVHIDTTRTEIGLQGRPDDDFEWTRMCEAPCDVRVPLAWEYRIVGDGLRASRGFALEGRAGDRIVLTIDPATHAGYVGGILVTVAGGAVIFVGAIVFVIGLLAALFNLDNAGEVVAGGTVVVGVGIAVVYLGAKMATSNGHTGVNVTAPRVAPRGVNGPSTPRAALWNEIAPRAAPAPPRGPAPSVPVLTIHF